MSQATIIYLISFYSSIYGVNPQVAQAVAQHESSLNPNALGSLGEIGLFQLRPQFVEEYSREELFDPEINIKVGIQKLAQAKRTCTYKKRLDWLVCYNAGNTAAKRIKNPSKFKYVLAVKQIIAYNN